MKRLWHFKNKDKKQGKFYSWNTYRSATHRRIINLPTNQKGYDTFETTVGKLSTRRIQIYSDYFCLGIILKIILNNFQNNA